MRIRAAAALAILLAAPACAQPAPAVTREVAVTFDDLPVISQVFRDLPTQQSITRELLDAIRTRRVPAIGFVNENKLNGDPARAALLEQWLAAGLELGNHGYAHLDLHRTPLAEYEADVLRGERVLRPMLARHGVRPRYFRHPFLHAGRSLDTRRGFERFLREHGYRIAPVTLDNSDYIFAAAYDRAVRDGRRADRERIAAEYLDYMLRVVAYYEQQSGALFSRNIRHVLLLHANRLNAEHFGSLADRLRARGYSFISLDRALEDPAYASPDEYAGPAGITWLHRWALTRGLRGSFFASEPEVPLWIQASAASH